LRGSGRIVVSFALGAMLAACGHSPEAGMTARGSGEGPTVMSLSPCIDAVLLKLANQGQIVSISHYSHDPRSSSVDVRSARAFPANYETAEEVVSARPDLVLLSPHVAPATQAAIRAAGIRVEVVGVPSSIAENRAQIRQIAHAIGQEVRGAALIATIDAALDRARAPVGGRAPGAIIRQSEGLVPGKGTIADELLTLTGFRNRSADYGLAMWDMLPLEVMAANPPDVVLTDGGAGEGTTRKAPPGVAVRAYPMRLMQCAGPTLMEAAARLASIRRGMVASQ